MRRVAWLGVMAVLAIGPSTGSAAVGPAAPAPEAPPAPCVAKAGVLCGKSRPTLASAAADLVGATDSARERRALRIASVKGLFGKRGKAAERRSDAALLKGLAAGPKTTRAAGPQLSGNNSVTRGEQNGELREVATAESNLTRGRVFQRRQFRLESSVESCPDPRPGESHGKSLVKGVAVYDVLTRVASRRQLITTSVHMRLDITQAALVTRYADLWAITGFGTPDKLRITTAQSVITKHGEHSAPSTGVNLEVDALSPGADIKFESETFNGWIAKWEAVENGDTNPFEDLTIPGKAYKALARGFAEMVGARVNALAKAAETGWKTPGKCAKLALTGKPPQLSPGAISRITSTVTPVRAGITEAALVRDATYNANYINGPGSAATVGTLPLDPGEPWFDFTAPAAPWPSTKNPGLDVFFYSKGGLARAQITFPGGPDRIAGPFSGDEDFATTPMTPIPWRLSWTGNVTAERTASSSGTYALSGGTVTVTFEGTGDCDLHGMETFDLLAANFNAASPVVSPSADKYTIGVAAPGASITVTKSNCTSAEQNGQTFGYPLANVALVYQATPQPIPNPPLYAGSNTGKTDPSSPDYHWTWNLQPF